MFSLLNQTFHYNLVVQLRAVYFDRIERQEVENIIDSIYQHVHSLEDIQFLIKYASEVFPSVVSQCSGDMVWENILKLQAELTAKRQVTATWRRKHANHFLLQTAIASLCSVMAQMYPEQEHSVVIAWMLPFIFCYFLHFVSFWGWPPMLQLHLLKTDLLQREN